MKLYLEVNIGTPEAPDWRRVPDVPYSLIRPAIEESNVTDECVALNEYEIANLKSALQAIAGLGLSLTNDQLAGNPLGALNTGDWVGQVYLKLPNVTQRPNKTPEECITDAREKL